MVKMGLGRADRIVVLVFAVLSAGMFLALGQLVVLQVSRPRLDEYLDNVLARSVAVAAAGAQVIRAEEASPNRICSDKDLEEMRYTLFVNEYLGDIGRLVDGKVACTAGWGRLPEPSGLPPPQRQQASGITLWANVPSPTDPRLVVDMASRDSVVVFTAPTAFKSLRRPGGGFAAVVLTQDGAHIFQSFGDAAGLPSLLEAPRAPFELGPRLTASACAPTMDICAVAALSNVDILRQPVPVWLGASVAGAFTGGCLGLALNLRHRAMSSLPQQIRRAVAFGRLQVVYQPLVRLKDERIVGVEALARLSDDHGRMISPDIFIAVAEESGFIGIISRAVIRSALAQMRDRLRGADEFHVHINLAVADLLDPTLLKHLDDEVNRLGIPPSRVVLELTERSSADYDRLLDAVERFRGRGYKFFIDDFGTGHSNLAYLAKLPINGIKIDKMFTKAIGKAAVSSAIVETICAMAGDLHQELVVEGVETREQAEHMLKLFPDAIGQGWLFGRPVPPQLL